MKNAIKIGYFILLILNILGNELAINALSLTTKPLLMPMLILGVYGVLKTQPKERILLVFALFFSFAGDVFLMYSAEIYFMLGLGSFLIAHVFYIRLFSIHTKTNYLYRILLIIPVLVFVAYFLYPSLPKDFQIPVYLYIVVITIMAVKASERVTDSAKSYGMVLVGAILFVVSDSCIAFSKFVNEFPFQRFWIMSTYGIAQYLITEGIITSLKTKKVASK